MKFLTRQSDHVSRSTLIWVLVAQAVSIFPLLFKLPLWVAIVWWAALIWRVQIFRGRLGFPNTVIKVVLGVLCIGLILSSYAGVAGVEPMVGFLVCSFILKLVEMHSKKDALIILFIGFVAIAAQFLFAQSLTAGLYAIFAFWVLIAAWRAVIAKRTMPWRYGFKRSGVMLLQSAPMLIVLFVVMPRLGPLWNVPLPQGHGKTGFSESLTMGDIGQLVRSYDVAFRVEFESVPPRERMLYWRAMVLDEFDGRQWRDSQISVFNRFENDAQRRLFAGVDPIQYSIIMEPHYSTRLFLLGYAVKFRSSQLKVHQTGKGLLESQKPVTQKAQYSVNAVLNRGSDARPLATAQRRRLLAYPSQLNPKSQALIAQWQREGLSSEEVMARLLKQYKDQFYYTLAPPVLGSNSVDDFMFNTQQGFCEHFASSFVLLMRMGGVPARVVLGYQGGRAHPNGFMTVRQSDAHAWAEVWLANKGWVRVDPTAAVAPDRILSGVEHALGEEDRRSLQAAHWQKRWFNQLSAQWEAMGYSWQRWVLNYDNRQKNAFLSEWLGGVSPWRLAMAFIAVCVLVVLAVSAGFWWVRRPIYRYLQDRLLAKVLDRLAREGFTRAPSETLAQFGQRVGQAKPAYQTKMKRIVQTYYATSYRTHTASDAALSRFKGAVKTF